MIRDLIEYVPVPGLTLDAVKTLTGLDWQRIDLDPDADPVGQLPTKKGVYVWVQPNFPHVVRYHGSGNGDSGLRGRLRDQLRWRNNQQARIRDVDWLGSGWEAASESPTIRVAAEEDLHLWVAVARPATWESEAVAPSSVDPTGEPALIPPPASALEWETFLSEASHLAAGHRSIVGGGAWEAKGGTLADRMCAVAWDRIREVLGADG